MADQQKPGSSAESSNPDEAATNKGRQSDNLYENDPRRLDAITSLTNLFSSTPRPAGDILKVAREAEALPGIEFFKLAVPYKIERTGKALKSGQNEKMGGAIRTIIADLEAMPANELVVVDIDAERLPKRQNER